MKRYSTVVGLASAVFMVGLYVGRFSANHKWVEIFSIALYVLNASIWLIVFHRETKATEERYRLQQYLQDMHKRGAE